MIESGGTQIVGAGAVTGPEGLIWLILNYVPGSSSDGFTGWIWLPARLNEMMLR